MSRRTSRYYVRKALEGTLSALPSPLRRALDVPLSVSRRRTLIADVIRRGRSSATAAPLTVLFWEPGGMPRILTRDGIIATALRMRSVETPFVICDGAPVACILREVGNAGPPSRWGKVCRGCFLRTKDEAEGFGVEARGIGSFVAPDLRRKHEVTAAALPLAELPGFHYRDVHVGRLALSSTRRFMMGYPIADQDDLMRRYLVAALVNVDAAHAAIDRYRPDRVFMSHGIYVDFGAALGAAVARGIPVVTWASGYLENHCYMHTSLQTRKCSFHALSDEGWEERKAKPLSADEEKVLEGYFAARYKLGRAFDVRLNISLEDREKVRARLSLPPGRPVIAVFTHISWDAVFDNTPMAFDSPEQWIIETIRTACRRPEATWLIKVHPAEDYTGTMEGVGEVIRRNFPTLPEHVRVIPSTMKLNPLSLYGVLDAGVTIFGTAGLEMLLLDKPVLVAGEAHYSAKGFTLDGHSRKRYLHLLERMPQAAPVTPQQRKWVRQYAYSFWIQRQLPVNAIKRGHSNWGPLDYHKKLDLLLPGRDPVLDMICDRIRDGRDFILPPEATPSIP